VDLACREADLVMETLPEEMEMKIDVFCILEKFARPGAILATNTATLSITEIAAVTTRAECCVGLRFPNGAPKGDRLEIVRGRETSEETVAACSEVGRRMGKEIVVVRDSGR
jgi:3-hydroxybutyryl-CoA dehydrogenase